LGDEFIAAVSVALDRIANGPASCPAWPGTQARDRLIRKTTVQRFPYVIAFEEHDQHLLVLAVAHSKRRPLYWLTRAEP
jgi:hypothetical protein